MRDVGPQSWLVCMGGLRLAVEWRALVSVGRCLLLEFACITTRTTRMKGVSLGTVVRVSAPASDGRVEEHFESVLQMSYISCPILSLTPFFSLRLYLVSCDGVTYVFFVTTLAFDSPTMWVPTRPSFSAPPRPDRRLRSNDVYLNVVEAFHTATYSRLSIQSINT